MQEAVTRRARSRGRRSTTDATARRRRVRPGGASARPRSERAPAEAAARDGAPAESRGATGTSGGVLTAPRGARAARSARAAGRSPGCAGACSAPLRSRRARRSRSRAAALGRARRRPRAARIGPAATRATATSSTSPIHSTLACPLLAPHDRRPYDARGAPVGTRARTSALQRNDDALRGAGLRRLDHPKRGDAGVEWDGGGGSAPPAPNRSLHPLVELDVASRLRLDRLRVAPRCRAVPTTRAAPRRSRDRPGRAPDRSASSCTSSPHFTYAAREPSARRRGPGCAASMVAERWERTPEECSSARKTSSSTCAPGSHPPHLRVHRAGRSEQLEHLVDQMRAEVEQDPARVLGTAALAPLAPVESRAASDRSATRDARGHRASPRRRAAAASGNPRPSAGCGRRSPRRRVPPRHPRAAARRPRSRPAACPPRGEVRRPRL